MATKYRSAGSLTTIPHDGRSMRLDITDPEITVVRIDNEEVLALPHRTALHMALQILSDHSQNAV